MSYILWYAPLCYAVLVVLEMCREDEPRIILKKSAKSFGVLTAVLAAGSTVFFLLNRYL